MKDEATLNRLSELRGRRHLISGERDRHAPLRQLDRQRRRDRQPVFRDVNQEEIARALRLPLGSATRARIAAAAAFVAAPIKRMRETIDHRVELGDQPACHVRPVRACPSPAQRARTRDAPERVCTVSAEASIGIARAPLVRSSVAACRNPCGGIHILARD